MNAHYLSRDNGGSVGAESRKLIIEKTNLPFSQKA